MDIKKFKAECEKFLNDSVRGINEISYEHFDEMSRRSHRIVKFCGGENLCVRSKGKWDKYLLDIQNLIKGLEAEFEEVWIVNLNVHCLDDDFELTVGISYFNPEQIID